MSKSKKSSTALLKIAGRKKGTPNQSTLTVIDACEKAGLNIIEGMIAFAKGDWRALGYESPTVVKPGFGGIEIDEFVIPVDLRYKALHDLSKYCYATRKAIEHTIDDDTKKVFTVNYKKPDKINVKD